MRTIKIISGGQTGADRGGLDAAIEKGVDHGGWCPKGRYAEDGTISEKYQLTETTDFGYLTRTKRNVAESDATVVFTFGPARTGSRKTIDFAKELKKPHLHVNLFQTSNEVAAEKVIDWLSKTFKDDIILNVAGSRESTREGIGEITKEIIKLVLIKIND
jgi:hypothetical protein